MGDFDDVLTANDAYAQTYRDEGKPGRAAQRLAVVTCMDSRIDPLGMLGMSRGDVKILRNAGARVTEDVLRTLVLANALLDVDRVLVVAHTDCRMTGDEQTVQQVLQERGIDARSLSFAVLPDQRAALERDVQRIRSWPFLPRDLPVAGAVLDVTTGRLEVVVP